MFRNSRSELFGAAEVPALRAGGSLQGIEELLKTLRDRRGNGATAVGDGFAEVLPAALC
jgi:hypothetical protein